MSQTRTESRSVPAESPELTLDDDEEEAVISYRIAALSRVDSVPTVLRLHREVANSVTGFQAAASIHSPGEEVLLCAQSKKRAR
jgi:hypothetical protein